MHKVVRAWRPTPEAKGFFSIFLFSSFHRRLPISLQVYCFGTLYHSMVSSSGISSHAYSSIVASGHASSIPKAGTPANACHPHPPWPEGACSFCNMCCSGHLAPQKNGKQIHRMHLLTHHLFICFDRDEKLSSDAVK